MVSFHRKPQLVALLDFQVFRDSLREMLRSDDLRRALPTLILVACLYNLLGLVFPMVILQIMDRVVVNQSMATLILLSIGVSVSLILEQLLKLANSSITHWLGARFEHAENRRLLQRFLQVPLTRLQQEENNLHVERMLASSTLAEFYSGQSLLVLLDIPFMLLFLVLIFIIGGWVVLVPIVLLGVFILLIGKFTQWLNLEVEKGRVGSDRRRSFLTEVLNGIYSVKTMAMEPQMERRHERLQASNAEISQTIAYGNALVAALSRLMSQLMIVSVIFASALAVLWGQMTPGGLAACMLLSIRTLQPLRRAISLWSNHQTVIAARRSVQTVEQMPLLTPEDTRQLSPIRQQIELRELSLQRQNGGPLFQKLSLTIKAGDCIVIQGQSGSGKSSLLGLINGIFQPEQGQVLLDGENLLNFTADSIQRQIALLPQAGTLITGTLLENMTMFNEQLNEAALVLASRLGLDSTVSTLKLGYETPVGEGNTEVVPAGIQQIVALIRELIYQPSVILFDEANSALDRSSDERLLEYLKQQKGQTTLVLITHRPSWQKIADHSFTIVDGQLVAGIDQQPHHEEALAPPPEEVTRPPNNHDLPGAIAQHFEQISDLALCLPTLLEALGWRGENRELMVALPHAQPHLDLCGLCNTLANLGWEAHQLKSRLDNLDERLLPALFLGSDQATQVLLQRLPDGRWHGFDSQNGQLAPLGADQRPGQIYVFKKIEAVAASSRRQLNFFKTLLARFNKLILLSFVLTVFNTLFGIAPPLFLRFVYDKVLPTGDWQMHLFLLLGVLLILGLDFYLRHLRSRIVAYVGGRADYILGTHVFRQIINLPISATANVSIRRQVERMRNFEGLRDFFLGPLATIALEVPANLIIVITIGILNPWALCVVLVSTILLWVLGTATKGISSRAVAASSRATSARVEFINETFYQMNTIRSTGGREQWLQRFREISAKASFSKFQDHQVHSRIAAFAQIITSLTGFSVLVVCAMGVINQQISSGAMIASMILVWRLVGPLQSIFLSAASLTRMRTSTSQIENLMRLSTETEAGVRQTIRPPLQGALIYSRVSFRYLSDSDPALLGISFSLQPGQFAVVAGPNASGKSTLLKLISRIYQPQAGSIRVDGVDIRQLTVTDLRTRISYLPQTNDIFYGTIAQNLRLSYTEATDAEIDWALTMVGLKADLANLPDGIDTRISESRSNQLPQGFLVRLALARAIIKPSPITLLDQPGDILDEAGEAALLRCIAYLRGRSTTLLISHRPSHLRLADIVIYMERGAITALGPYDTIQDRINAQVSSS